MNLVTLSIKVLFLFDTCVDDGKKSSLSLNPELEYLSNPFVIGIFGSDPFNLNCPDNKSFRLINAESDC